MKDDQRHARIFGVLFIVTFITSIVALALFQPVLDDPVGYIAGGGKAARSTWSLPGAAASRHLGIHDATADPVARQPRAGTTSLGRCWLIHVRVPLVAPVTTEG